MDSGGNSAELSIFDGRGSCVAFMSKHARVRECHIQLEMFCFLLYAGQGTCWGDCGWPVGGDVVEVGRNAWNGIVK